MLNAMKIIDIIIRSFLYFTRGESIKHLSKAILVANILLSLNVCALLSYLIGPHIESLAIIYNDTITIAVVAGTVWYYLLRFLQRVYLNKRGYSRILSTYVPKVVGILIVIVHYIFSVYWLVESLFYLVRHT